VQQTSNNDNFPCLPIRFFSGSESSETDIAMAHLDFCTAVDAESVYRAIYMIGKYMGSNSPGPKTGLFRPKLVDQTYSQVIGLSDVELMDTWVNHKDVTKAAAEAYIKSPIFTKMTYILMFPIFKPITEINYPSFIARLVTSYNILNTDPKQEWKAINAEAIYPKSFMIDKFNHLNSLVRLGQEYLSSLNAALRRGPASESEDLRAVRLYVYQMINLRSVTYMQLIFEQVVCCPDVNLLDEKAFMNEIGLCKKTFKHLAMDPNYLRNKGFDTCIDKEIPNRNDVSKLLYFSILSKRRSSGKSMGQFREPILEPSAAEAMQQLVDKYYPDL